MWHASIASPVLREHELERRARAILDGVGDASLGEWLDVRPRALHMRRRLSTAERAIVGDVLDLRGTPEATARLDEIRRAVPGVLPIGWRE